MELHDRTVFRYAPANARHLALQNVEIGRRHAFILLNNDVAGAEETQALAEGDVHVQGNGRSGALRYFVHSLEVIRAESVVPDRRRGIAGIARSRAVVLGEEILSNTKFVAHLLQTWMGKYHREGPLPRLGCRSRIDYQSLLGGFNKEFGIFDRRIRQYAMAEIENVAASPESANGAERHLANFLRRCQQNGWIDVSLQGDFRTKELANLSQLYAPVDAEDICPGSRHRREEMLRGLGVVNERNTSAHSGNDFLDGWKREIPVVLQIQLAAPGVEQLDSGSPRGDLGVQVRNRCLSNAVEQFAEGLRLVVETALGRGKAFLRFAFHHVTRERPRGGRKTQDRNLGTN